MNKKGESGPFGLSLTQTAELILAVIIAVALIYSIVVLLRFYYNPGSSCKNQTDWELITSSLKKLMEENKDSIETPFFNNNCPLVSFSPQHTQNQIQPASANLIDQQSRICLCNIIKDEQTGLELCSPERGKCLALEKGLTFSSEQISTRNYKDYLFITFFKQGNIITAEITGIQKYKTDLQRESQQTQDQRICNEPSGEQLQQYLQKAQTSFPEVKLSLINAVILTESNVRHCSQDGKFLASSAGAQGYMQIIPKTAQVLGVNPSDPEQNIFGGAKLLSLNLDIFKEYPDAEKLAVAHYNCGAIPEAVQKYCSDKTQHCWPKIESQLQYGGDYCQQGPIDIGLGRKEGQTKNYVEKVTCYERCFSTGLENCSQYWSNAQGCSIVTI